MKIFLDKNLLLSLNFSRQISVAAFKKASLINLPLLAALKSLEKNDNGLYEMYLYDTTDDHDVFINQHLVDEGVVTSKVFSKTSK